MQLQNMEKGSNKDDHIYVLIKQICINCKCDSNSQKEVSEVVEESKW